MTNRVGQKHLIKCRCVLPQFKKLQNPPAHQFIVFSIIEEDNFLVSYAQCNNCGVIHKIVDACKSEIQSGKEHMNSLIKIDDIKHSIHQNFSSILENNNADLPTWLAVQFIVENKQWGNFAVITKDVEGDEIHGKCIRILGESLCKVEAFTRFEGAI
jgi:hypothetical protein